MANRRMFARSVINDDRFYSMSDKAKLLYFILGMDADDDGFIGSPLRIAKAYDADRSHIQELIDAGLLIAFQSGPVVIADWRVNNEKRCERRTPTRYQGELEQLIIVNKRYHLIDSTDIKSDRMSDTMYDKMSDTMYDKMDDTEKDSLGKNRLGSLSKVSNSSSIDNITLDNGKQVSSSELDELRNAIITTPLDRFNARTSRILEDIDEKLGTDE